MSYYDCEENLNFIQNLAVRLTNMGEDVLHFATYGGPQNTSYIKYIKDSLNFSIGSFICQKYLYGHINLDTFFEEMIGEGLKEFIVELPVIPTDIKNKYDLNNMVTEADGVAQHH
jgi:hypothetical protein